MSKSHLAISSALAIVGLLACGGGGPPPRPTEVAMDPSSGGSASTTSAPADPSASSTSSDADPSAALTGMGDPSAATATAPTATAAADPPADPKAGKGKKGKKGDKTAAASSSSGGGALSKSECQQLSDKGVDLLLAGMGGLDPSMAAQIKAQAASDPNMAGMMGECTKSTTRAQYKCGMAAASKDEWQTCLK